VCLLLSGNYYNLALNPISFLVFITLSLKHIVSKKLHGIHWVVGRDKNPNTKKNT
jgi:hypothetical protein